MKIFNVAIIGCGKISEKHADILVSKKIKHLKLVAAYDIKKNIAELFAKKYKIKYFNNIHKLLSSVKIDLVVICSDSGSHYKNALIASKYKKDLIIEKPICLDINQAKKIIKIYKKNKNRLFVVMQNRFNPAAKLLKETIKKKLFGKITSISVKVWWSRDQLYYNKDSWRGTWSQDGGLFMNQAIHYIDMMNWLMGPVKSLTALIKKRLVKIETEDVGAAILEFKNGVLGVIEASTAVRPKNIEGSVTILGENGNVKIGGNYMNKLEFYNFQKNKEVSNALLKKFYQRLKKNENSHFLFYLNVIKDLLKRNIKSKKDINSIDGNEGIKSLEIVKAIYYSVIRKKNINLPLNSKIKNFKKKLIHELCN